MKAAMHVGLAGSLLLASMAQVQDCDCDKPTPTCKMNCSKIGLKVIDTRRKCKYLVKDQFYKAIAPSIFQMNIWEKHKMWPHTCDPDADQAGFSFSCEECSRYHQPCNNSHASCGGCECTWQPKAEKIHGKRFVDFMVDDLGEQRNMTTHLTCPYVKQAYMYPNYHTVECEEESDLPPRQGNISAIREDVEDGWNASTIASGFIHGGCTVYPYKLGCEKVPLILKFDCDDCVSQGSRLMLTKCCNKCQEFVDGLESNPLIPKTILPIGFCSGCDSKVYTFEDSPFPNWPPAPWRDYKRFEEYTEAKALEKFEKYIDDSVCTHLTPPCDVVAVDQNGDPAEECHDGCCPSDPGACDADGCCLEHHHRRLGFMEPIGQEKNETQAVLDPLFYCPLSNIEGSPIFSAPEVVLEPVEPKAVIKTTMALPGTVAMYQTEEAKTALRYGFANTLEEVLESWITVSVKAADGGRRLSTVSAEFTINVPSSSSVEASAITESVESVALDNGALATNLQESFAVHAQSVDVSTVDFSEATVSTPEIVLTSVSTSSTTSTLVTEESTPSVTEGSEDVPETDSQVGRIITISGAVVVGLGLIGGIAALVCRRRRKGNNPDEANNPAQQVVGKDQQAFDSC